MDFINLYISESSLRYLFIALLFLTLFIVLVLIFNFIIKKWKLRTHKSKSHIDEFIIRMFKIPGIWIIFTILLNIFSSLLQEDVRTFAALQKVSKILLIITLGWLIVQVVRATFRYWQNKLDLNNTNNLEARKRLTQMSMVERIIIILVVVIFVSVALMTIDSVRQLGVSLLASAGVAGIVLGFAAQRSFGQIFSGVQIAFTQPVRLDDVVVIEGEWGRVEEINITYAVVKIWDERRLIVPIDYFLNNPIQNWTRTTSDILGTVFLYVSYDLPVQPLRDELARVVKDNPHWDGRVQNIQITDSKQWYKELRVLVSSSNSSLNWNLRVDVREKLIDFINIHYPGSFAKINSGGSTSQDVTSATEE